MATAQSQQTDVDGAGAQETFTVVNPATGETISELSALNAAGVNELVERARKAQPGWEALGFARRASLLRDLRKWLIENRRRAIRTLSEENGKPWEDSRVEVFYVADSLGFWAKNAKRYLSEERVRPHSPFLIGRKLVGRFRPHGVVGVIGPWNYPLVNNFGDAIPALMAGNAVVLKPSSLTPLSSLLVAEGLREVGLPADVFLVANGGGSVGGALVDTVDMLHFTGSTAVGKQIAQRAANRLLPVTLELGGNDPMIVLEGANLERAANAAVWGGLQNGGQTCISVERIYVEKAAYEPFVQKVVDKVRAVRVGTPTGPAECEVGAITNPEQLATIEEHVRDALEKGAKLEIGGKQPETHQGTFFQPTVLTSVDHSMKVMAEETFGPILPIMRVDSADEAVRLANDSNYGLDSSVFAARPARGEQIARQIEAGATVVNDALTNYFATEIPLGGVKESGLGARHGAAGIQKYCQRQNVVVTRFGLNRELYYFPYTKRTAKLLDWGLVALFGRGRKRKKADRQASSES